MAVEYQDWMDFDLNKHDSAAIEKILDTHCRHAYLMREDIFDKYPDGRRIQRVYFESADDRNRCMKNQ